MKIFLDVGAHVGETLRSALDPKYAFRKIVCFEPVRACRQELTRFKDPRIQICPFGLWKETCELPIFDPGSEGASIFVDKNRTDRFELAAFVRASDWFRDNVSVGDQVFLKLNCEGSEADVLEDLIDGEEIRKVHRMLVFFDVRKIPSQRHREAQLLASMEAHGVEGFALGDNFRVRGPNHFARIQSWLDEAGANEYANQPRLARLRSRLMHLRYVQLATAARSPQTLRLGHAVRRALPGGLDTRMRAIWTRISRGF